MYPCVDGVQASILSKYRSTCSVSLSAGISRSFICTHSTHPRIAASRLASAKQPHTTPAGHMAPVCTRRAALRKPRQHHGARRSRHRVVLRSLNERGPKELQKSLFLALRQSRECVRQEWMARSYRAESMAAVPQRSPAPMQQHAALQDDVGVSKLLWMLIERVWQWVTGGVAGVCAW